MERLSIECPACECPSDPTLFSTCASGSCAVVDLETSALTACTLDDECMATAGTCGPNAATVPLRRGLELQLAEALGCTPAPLSSDDVAHVRCQAGHCRLGAAPEPALGATDGPTAADLPVAGRPAPATSASTPRADGSTLLLATPTLSERHAI